MDLHFLIPIAHAAEEAVQHAAEITHAAEPVTHEAASNDVLGTLGINWKLFVAQLVNFGIVLAVLWKWVFTPVANKLTERTEKIEKAMRDASNTEKEKQDFEKWKNEQIVNTRHQASVIVSQAQTDAAKVKEHSLNETREEQEKLVEQAKKQIQQEKQQALASAKSELADLVTNVTEKILKEKLDGKKDEGLIKEMLRSI